MDPRRPTLPLLLALVVAGCGGDDGTGPRPVTGAAAAPPLASAPERAGEILVRGDASPREHGPYAFSGRYRIRFEQRAPEDPALDFATQTPFTLRLVRPAAGGPGQERRLFSAAARSGRRTLRIDGRWIVSADYGDFPYAVRFTPDP